MHCVHRTRMSGFLDFCFNMKFLIPSATNVGVFFQISFNIYGQVCIYLGFVMMHVIHSGTVGILWVWFSIGRLL